MQLFKGLQIALDLGISLNFKKKSELRKAIVDNGGTISYIVTKKCHIVVTSDPEKCDISSKCRMAVKYGLPVLKLDFIWDCLSVEALKPYDAYVVGGKATSLDFKSGKISAGKLGSQPKQKKKRRSLQFNPNSVQAWKGDDPAQPQYNEKSHEVAKYAIFTCFNSGTNCEDSYVIELHAPSQVQSQDSNRQEDASNKTESLPYRVLFQSGSTSSMKHFLSESRYTATADQALDVYAMLFNSVAKKPEAQVCRTPVRGLGSTLLQRKLAEVVHVHEGCSEQVKDLVEHVWREAISEVTSILGNITSIKLDQVEKADAVLSKISSALQSSQSEKDIEKLVTEFYTTLNVKERSVKSDHEAKLPWKKWLVKKRDVCQLVKDIVSVSEMTNYESQAVVEAKYAALRCRITALDGAQREEIEKLVLSNIDTSVKYSAPSSTKGTRLMLINEVALGKTKEFLSHDTSLTSAPDGYDSTHGVGKSENSESEFKVHEYVVYRANQQRIRYIVEFATADDVPQPLDIGPQDDTYITSDTNKTKKDVSLHDVLEVANPMDKIKPGLVGTGDQEVKLKGVHIRAKLVDLAGEVVVLQEYYNNSSQPIEAKYVFPLGEAAAVCGFEAFINGKHVVGEVKEKETAHKEYKEAISQGHGAYLMDQDKETPDVFTVSVGNLPAGACVLIKITYVTELRIEDEKISFRLPGTVAPWKENQALLQATQTELKSHKTKAMNTSVHVAVEMPFDIRTLHCPTHKVKVKQTASKAYVELAGHQEFGSGFLLLIGLAEIHVPRMWVEQHPSKSDHQACMLTFYPEFELEEVMEGEIIILLDMSNSMKGTQILKLALLVLQNIPQGFKFNVIRFGSDYEELFPSPKLKADETIAQAREFVESSSMSLGSTDVRSALRPFYLLPPGNESGTDLPRNVFLLSDGHLVEERLLLEEAARHYMHTRIFTFGVSPTCNSHTLRALSRVSAGAFEYFDPKTKSKWHPKVKSQITKAMQPGLTSVSVEWRQYDDNLPPPAQAPRQITALFSGSQQIVYGYVPNCTMVTLKAEVGGQEVSTVVSTSELSITEGLLVHRLTARAIIQDWEAGVLARDRTHHELTKMELKDYVIDLSKEYSIVTQLTSFVAVEKREENEKDSLPKGPTMKELLNKESVENLPYMGWTSVPEPSLESLIEELSFKDDGDKLQDEHQERAEKTALLEKFYLNQSGRAGPCSLETLQAATVLAQSYKSLGEQEKAEKITLQAFKEGSAEIGEVMQTANYSAIASCLADLRCQLPLSHQVSEVAEAVIPWPKQGYGSIKVRTLTGGIEEFTCTSEMSISQLKDLIYGRDGVPQDTQRLIYKGKQLEDFRTLRDCGADCGAVFHLVQRLRGGGDGGAGVQFVEEYSLPEAPEEAEEEEQKVYDDDDDDDVWATEEESDEEMGFSLFGDECLKSAAPASDEDGIYEEDILSYGVSERLKESLEDIPMKKGKTKNMSRILSK
ncbi:poly [ADP-ribose] polymerase [Elysia marginata]|uniref:Poly [ADP-ribose] polymerase n=1 Tax=Elysia marginata TaxID=1093978 RepID=A0AAV4EZZ6_9GAST|nr:poly [ADP-ribose] polymerase [Elysia marginata]